METILVARFLDVIDLPLPLVAAFDYLADFSHTGEWDPGVAEARRLDDGPLRVGSRFEVVVRFLGRRIPMEYSLTRLEPPHHFALRGTGGSVVSLDEITLAPVAGGTRVTYDARLELSGLAKLGDPLLGLVFQRLGAAAARGLRQRAEKMSAGAKRARRSSRRDAARWVTRR